MNYETIEPLCTLKQNSKTYDKHLILQIKSCVANQMVKAHVKGYKKEQEQQAQTKFHKHKTSTGQ